MKTIKQAKTVDNDENNFDDLEEMQDNFELELQKELEIQMTSEEEKLNNVMDVLEKLK